MRDRARAALVTAAMCLILLASWYLHRAEEIESRSQANDLIEAHGGRHGLYLFLIENGNEAHVRFLITELRELGDIEPGRDVICTRGHVVEALESITGVAPGSNYADWTSWYRAAKGVEFEPID